MSDQMHPYVSGLEAQIQIEEASHAATMRQLMALRRPGGFLWAPEDCPRIDFVELSALYPEQELFQEFAADIHHEDGVGGDSLGTMGRVSGLVGWDAALWGEPGALWSTADVISDEVAEHGKQAEQIFDSLLDRDAADVRHLLILNRVRLHPEYRGRRLLGQIVDNILEILPLEPEQTLVTTWPEPQDPDGHFSDNWPGRGDALVHMRAAHEAAGFQRWRDSRIWWRVGNSVQH